MEIILGIVAGLSVVGLIVLGIIQILVSSKEREKLELMIKSKDLPEYVAVTQQEDEEEGEQDKEVAIDDIPFLEDTRK